MQQIRLEPGSMVLTPAEVHRLREGIRRWEAACDEPGLASDEALLDLGCDVRDIVGLPEKEE